MAIKKANEKQIKLLESLLRKSKYELTGKRLNDLNSVECSVFIDFLMNNCTVKTVDYNGNPIDEFYIRKNKILIEENLTYNESKIIGAASPRAIEFLKKLVSENKYELTISDEDLTAKTTYILTNHLLNKEPNQEFADKYLKDIMKKEDTLNTDIPFDEPDFIESIDMNIPEE